MAFGRSVAQMQGAIKFVTGATLKVVRIANFIATPQVGDDSFKQGLHAAGSGSPALPASGLSPDNQMI